MSKILIVDDDAKFADELGNYLRENGFEVVYSSKGEEGLAKAFEILPDVIILETMIPPLDAIGVLRSLKSNDRTKEIPVLILTKHKVPEMRVEAAKLGVTVYFEKENTSKDLLLRWIQELVDVEKVLPVASDDSSHKVLLVEDDPLMVNLYKKALRLIGLQVDIARDGSEALSKVKVVKPSIILLDIMMPKMDGFGVLKALKADPLTNDIPVVILTNLEGQQDIEMAMSLGAVKYIVKSELEPGEVVKIVKEILGRGTPLS